MADFLRSLRESFEEEARDANKYAYLARMAETEEDRKILIEIAKQELVHRAKVEGILLGYGEVMTK